MQNSALAVFNITKEQYEANNGSVLFYLVGTHAEKEKSNI